MRALGILGPVLLASCVVLASRLDEVTTVEGTWTGLDPEIEACARSGGTLRLLAVHGIGPHEMRWSDTLVSGLAGPLALERSGEEEIEDVVSGPAGDAVKVGVLRTADWTGTARPDRKLRVIEVTWSPAVDGIKRERLAFDDTEQLRSRRLETNGMLKQGITNRRLADAVLYIGAYQPAIQLPVERGLVKVLAEEDPARDRMAVVTMSLGSSIVFDCLEKIGRDDHPVRRGLPEIPLVDGRIRALAARRHTVFLLANQLALIELARVRPPADEAAADNGNGGPTGGASGAEELPAEWHLDLVAIGDPNDLLGYTLTPSFAEDCRHRHLDVSIANVLTNVATQAIVGALADPLGAHNAHGERQQVLDLMVHGPAGRPPERAPVPEPDAERELERD